MVRSCFFFGASTLAFAALAASYYGDSDYNPRIISILPQSDQALQRDSQKLFCDATRDATRSAMDACDANSRNTIHRRSQRCDKVLLIWVRHHDIRAV